MKIEENVSLKKKTTMRIGGLARYYAELHTKEDTEEALQFAQSKNLPLIVLGGGSNTIFEEGVIEGVIVKVAEDTVELFPKCSSFETHFGPSPCHPEEKPVGRRLEGRHGEGPKCPQDDILEKARVTIYAGKILASLINELAQQNLDLSPLTGIPGTVGGAIFGNAGQGPKGIWIDHFVESVEFFWQGKWQTFTKEQCEFDYRESIFKAYTLPSTSYPPIVWSVTLDVPSRPAKDVKEEIERLIQKRIETQPHLKTAGSCFKAVNGTPAWKLIDSAGLRGIKIGNVQIAEKHANFLLNIGEATFEDAKRTVEKVRKSVPEKLEVEMRFIGRNGALVF